MPEIKPSNRIEALTAILQAAQVARIEVRVLADEVTSKASHREAMDAIGDVLAEAAAMLAAELDEAEITSASDGRALITA